MSRNFCYFASVFSIVYKWTSYAKREKPKYITIMRKTIILAAVAALTSTAAMAQQNNFNYSVDRFADIEVLRYQVPEFDNLSLNQKKMVYYLTQAALQGRDILFDQNCRAAAVCAKS